MVFTIEDMTALNQAQEQKLESSVSRRASIR